MISAYCVAGVCASLEIHWEMFCGSMWDMHLATHEIHEPELALLSE